MDALHEGQKVWVEQPDGTATAAVYVGEADQSTWFGGTPRCYVVYPETQSGEEVEALRVVPREDDDEDA